jgi:hypothetical protein
MNKFNLSPGFYKIRKTVYQPYGAKHERINTNSIKLLRVVGNGSAKRYFINEDQIGKDPANFPELNNYEIVSQYANSPSVSVCNLILAFQDGSGTTFQFQVNSISMLKRMSETIPDLKKFIEL